MNCYNYCLLLILVGAMLSACQNGSYTQYAADKSLPDRVDFNFHIKPILSDRCFACHGPDEEARSADLRLDTEEGAFTALGEVEKRFAIKAGNLDASEVWHRIISKDEEFIMPPPESNLSLNNQEIALIGKWIDQGAEWKEHWSFIPPKKSNFPSVKEEGKIQNEIDQFVLARLEQEGTSFTDKASKERLMRRISFGLRGIPPQVEELEAFKADDSEDALEKVIDEMLASEAYGERMAIDWLDVARYADTHGYQADRERRMWPWRDWVIKAFNNNMPYDEFSRWQLAGDLMPNPSREQILATGFNRNHMQTEEGGSVEEEFRAEYVADRTITTSRAFLGLTMECARCHDHKYDPISQKEFYQLFSFFNSVDESGQTSFFTDAVPVPALKLTAQNTDSKAAEIRASIEKMESQIPQSEERFKNWLARSGNIKPNLTKGKVGDFSFDRISNKKLANAARPRFAASIVDDPILVSGHKNKGLKLSGENGLSFKDLGVFSRSDPFSLSIWVKAEEELDRAVIVHRTQAVLDAGSRGYELMIDQGKISLALTHMWPHNEIRKLSKKAFPINEWVHLTMTYDGSSQARGLSLFINGEKTEMDIIKDNLTKDILYERVKVHLAIGYRFRGKGFKNGIVDEFKVFDRCLSQLEVSELAGKRLANQLAAKNMAELSPKERELLKEFYLRNIDADFQQWEKEIRKLRDEERSLIDTVPEIMIMKDLPQARPTFVLNRGAYDQPGEEVYAGTPSKVLAFSEELPPNRLGLADWLFDAENPLTARVMVNRIWQMHFGKGLVSTPEDFGNQGALPSHPELLDFLAVRFIESGWDIKALHKLILSSATYQQDSYASAELREKDPDNVLLARGPAFRLSAEMLRDQALATSGLLVEKVGGPSVKPYQPEGLWKEKSGKIYLADKGDGLYRKSLYTFWKRTSPPPNMMTFDATDRNICIVKRQSTSTPLQALVLLNDVQFVEASRKLGERMLHTSEKPEEQIRMAFSLLTCRQPSTEESQVLNEMYAEQLTEFKERPEAAHELLSEGDSSVDESLDPLQLATATVIANAIMNFDESIMLR
ncbi:MAG: DUF1553 domain-containing protein [Bacteroidia bacterium]|nr:DUF1553 domain-containing protein [Bacteroidia bacterium]